MNRGQTHEDHTLPEEPDDVGVASFSEAEIAEFASAISDFFSGRPLGDIRDTFATEDLGGKFDAFGFDARRIVSPQLTLQDDPNDSSRGETDPGQHSEGSDDETDRRRPHRQAIRAQSEKNDLPTGKAHLSVENLIAEPSPAGGGHVPGRHELPEVASSTVRTPLDFKASGLERRLQQKGEDFVVEAPHEGRIFAGQAIANPIVADPGDDRRISRIAERFDLGSESGPPGSAPAEIGVMSMNRTESGRVTISSSRMFADPSGMLASPSMTSQAPQAILSPSVEARGLESPWPGDIQADLQRMNDLLETLVAESARGRLGGIPAASSRLHSLR